MYEDADCLAFRDVEPQAPKHILVIPRRRIAMLGDVEDTDQKVSKSYSRVRHCKLKVYFHYSTNH